MRVFQVSIAVLFLTVFLSARQGAPPPDLKGWHGAEWGMTPDQVAKAVGFQLGEPLPPGVAKQQMRAPSAERFAADFTVIKEYSVPKVPVGDSQFFFGESGRSGLTTVVLDFGGSVPFTALRDEVKAKYGSPTSDKSDVIGKLTFFYVTWIFPSTEITISGASEPMSIALMYRRHTAL
jgi:hypothetical protein